MDVLSQIACSAIFAELDQRFPKKQLWQDRKQFDGVACCMS
jgi:hypothetical protein